MNRTLKRGAAIFTIAAAFAAMPAANAWYEFEETIVDEVSSGINTILKYSDCAITAGYKGYRGGNMEEYYSMMLSYDLTDGIVTKSPKYYHYIDIEGSSNKISYYSTALKKYNEFSMIDAYGNTIVPAGLYDFMYTYGGYVVVRSAETYGVLSADGEIVKTMEPGIVYEWGDPLFSEFPDVTVLKKKAGDKVLFGIVDYKLDIVHDFEYDYIGAFRQGRAIAKRGEMYAVINKYGTPLTEFKYTLLAFATAPNYLLAFIGDERLYLDDELNEVDEAAYMEVEKEYFKKLFPSPALKIRDVISCDDELYNVNTGEIIISADEGMKISRRADGNFVFYGNGRSGLLNKDGAHILDINFQVPYNFQAPYIKKISDGFYSVTYTGDHTRIVDFMGNDVLGRAYNNDIIKLDGGIYAVLDGGYIKMLRSSTIDIAYNTSVRTRINGAEIPCYAVDGYCAVFAEDMRGYGFDVVWNGDEMRLDISRNPDYKKINPVELPEKGTASTPYADIVNSPVKVYYDGEEIKSYSIDGKTLIRPESINDSRIDFNYNNGVLDIHVDGLEEIPE